MWSHLFFPVLIIVAKMVSKIVHVCAVALSVVQQVLLKINKEITQARSVSFFCDVCFYVT